MTDERVCTVCVFCCREDYGYSNWTVEGTSLFCLRGLNPALDGAEEPWREPSPELLKALDVAATCPGVSSGHSGMDGRGRRRGFHIQPPRQ